MISYLFESTMALFVMFALYKVFIEKEQKLNFNRAYLLFTLIFSLIIPFATISIQTELMIPQTVKHLESTFQLVNSPAAVELPKENIPVINYYLLFYLLVFSILIFRFATNIIKILLLIRQNQHLKEDKITLVLMPKKMNPYSFFKYIFVYKTDFESGKIPDELICHEKEHGLQNHTLDILIIELIKVLLWFNPLIWLYARAIRFNHELLADRKVLTSFKLEDYQKTLLTTIFRNNSTYLVSNFNYSFIKKRLIMMTKKNSKDKGIVSYILTIAIFIVLTITMACEKESVYPLNVDPNDVVWGKLVENHQNDWWFPLLQEALNKETNNIVENIYELGGNRTVSDGIETIDDAVYIMKRDSSYSVMKCPFTTRDLKTGLITGDKAKIKSYDLKKDDLSTIFIYNFIIDFENSKKITLIKNGRFGVSYD